MLREAGLELGTRADRLRLEAAGPQRIQPHRTMRLTGRRSVLKRRYDAD